MVIFSLSTAFGRNSCTLGAIMLPSIYHPCGCYIEPDRQLSRRGSREEKTALATFGCVQNDTRKNLPGRYRNRASPRASMSAIASRSITHQDPNSAHHTPHITRSDSG